MPFQVIFVVLLGLLFMYLGYLIYTRKAPNLLDLFLKQGVSYNDAISAKVFGSIIIIIGVIILLLPLILGVENMNV